MTISDPASRDWGRKVAFAPDRGEDPGAAAPARAEREGRSDLQFVAGRRSAADFARARRHSRMVGLLKVGLPVGGAVSILAIIGALLFAGGRLPSVDIGETKIEDGKLVMDNPELNGTDSNRRPYNLTARKAIQDAETPTRIMLEEIQARLPMSDDAFAVVKAGNGVYDAEGKTLRLGGGVAVDTEDGMSIRLKDAHIDIETGTLDTTQPVVVDTGRAVVSSDTLSVQEKGKRIVFESRVRMTIRPAGAAGAGAAPLRGAVTPPGPQATENSQIQ